MARSNAMSRRRQTSNVTGLSVAIRYWLHAGDEHEQGPPRTHLYACRPHTDLLARQRESERGRQGLEHVAGRLEEARCSDEYHGAAQALRSILCDGWRNPRDAQRAARTALDHYPALAPYVAHVALRLAREDASLEALDVLERVLAIGYCSPELARTHARLLGKLGYVEAAQETLQLLWSEFGEEEH
jgi:hypothetical protein